MEIEQANASLRDSLAGRISAVSNVQKSQSIDKSVSDAASSYKPPKKSKNVDTTKEFVDTINYNLNSASAGFQIIMTESKDHKWFQQKVNEEMRVNAKYGVLRKWDINPNTFANTQLTAQDLA